MVMNKSIYPMYFQTDRNKSILITISNKISISPDIVLQPDKVFLANRIDGEFITDADIRNVLRLIEGRGV